MHEVGVGPRAEAPDARPFRHRGLHAHRGQGGDEAFDVGRDAVAVRPVAADHQFDATFDAPLAGPARHELRRYARSSGETGRAAKMGDVQLPVSPPVAPMLAKSVPTIPPGASYEPKWDGFRTIVFRDGDEVELGSRNEKPMTRYFPEVVDAVRRLLPERIVLDGEIVVADQRAARVRGARSSASTPRNPG